MKCRRSQSNVAPRRREVIQRRWLPQVPPGSGTESPSPHLGSPGGPPTQRRAWLGSGPPQRRDSLSAPDRLQCPPCPAALPAKRQTWKAVAWRLSRVGFMNPSNHNRLNTLIFLQLTSSLLTSSMAMWGKNTAFAPIHSTTVGGYRSPKKHGHFGQERMYLFGWVWPTHFWPN